MNRERLSFALEQLESGQWELFEQFASQFLVAEFPSLRTVAAATGDGGRDAELFLSDGRPNVVLQYSIAQGWNQKIRRTVRRLREIQNPASLLVYVTNQPIGASADRLKLELGRDHGLHLDVRDKTYFLDRLGSSESTLHAAERLANRTVDPILEARGLVRRPVSPLESGETQAALLYLALEWKDKSRGKSLTKVGYEGLVRSTLIGTSPENRMTRDEVRRAVAAVLSNHPEEAIRRGVDRALAALTKKAIRHYRKSDEYCLTFDERARLSDLQASLDAGDRALQQELEEELRVAEFDLMDKEREDVVSTTVRLTEALICSRGEAFAAAVVRDEFGDLTFGALSSEFIDFLKTYPVSWDTSKLSIQQYLTLVTDLLAEPGDAVRRHLRELANAYTLFAFLRLAPDVNEVLAKIAGHGEIWLDTSVLLPVLADEAFEEPGRFTLLLQAAGSAGMDLRVTDGVLEELNTHMDRCLAYVTVPAGDWRGSTPYLISEYMRAGRPMGGFRDWLKGFRGKVRPEADIAEFLAERIGVERAALEKYVDALDQDVRLAIERAWNAVHDRRRRDGDDDSIARLRLARHDIVNYAGVVGKRGGSRDSALGYRCWWLTVDSGAFSIRGRLVDDLGRDAPDSPVISADFLTNALLFGPSRDQLPPERALSLPVVVDAGLVEYLTPELVKAAADIREESADLPERVRARQVRDHLDRNRWRYGRIANAGLEQIEMFD